MHFTVLVSKVRFSDYFALVVEKLSKKHRHVGQKSFIIHNSLLAITSKIAVTAKIYN